MSPKATLFVLNPVAGAIRISSPFGPRIHPVTGKRSTHNGVDIRGAEGTEVVAPFAGVVKFDDDSADGEGGIQVIIQNDDGWRVGMAHLLINTVDIGERVDAGDIVGAIGQTGRVTGPHLHLTLRNPAGVTVDPMPFLKVG